jgi:4-hydroxy-3-polyprenylbenzoate decarboxylase
LKAKLEAAGIPGIQRVFSLARPYLRVISLKQSYPEHVNDLIRLIEPGGDQYNGHHIWVLVDDDIDPANSAEVLWAIAGRCAPETGVRIIPGTAVWQLDPRIHPEHRSSPDQEGGRRPYVAHNLVINACRPYEWIGEFPPVCVNSPELRARILERWREVFD